MMEGFTAKTEVMKQNVVSLTIGCFFLHFNY